MTKTERIVVTTAWTWLRDHSPTPEPQAIRDALSKIIQDDIARRHKKKTARA